MSAPVAFLDTETTGLDPDRHEIWEVALIISDPGGGTPNEYVWQLPVDLGRADPIALNIGRFHERRLPQGTAEYRPWGREEREARFVLHPERLPDWCWHFARLTRGLHLVGAVVSFDAERLWRLLRANGECPMWHYHLIDVEALAAGWITAAPAIPEARHTAVPPWKSEDLSRGIGVDPDDFGRHSALGDARWAAAMYEAVMGT